MMSDEEFTFGMPAQPKRETEMNEQELQDVIESKKEHICYLECELNKHKVMLQRWRNTIDSQQSTIASMKGEMENAQSEWEKERKGMCRAVTRASKARNAMGRWTVAIQNENDLLRLMLKDRGINADFMWKAKRAMEKLDEIYGLYSVEMPAIERCLEIQKVIDNDS